MSYIKDEQGVVYYSSPEDPTAVYSVQEWEIERTRLITGLTLQIENIQNQIDNNSEPITILDAYSQEVKDLISEHNEMIPNTDDLEAEKLGKETLLNEITNL